MAISSRLAALLMLVAASAGAQDVSQLIGVSAEPRPSLRVVESCEAEKSVQLCLEPRLEGAQGAVKTPARRRREQDGRLTRFTRLAGMFMGRVDVLDTGSFRFRFNLELR